MHNQRLFVLRLVQIREGITSRTAALDGPQEREQAAAWVNVRARSGYVKQLASGLAHTIKQIVDCESSKV